MFALQRLLRHDSLRRQQHRPHQCVVYADPLRGFRPLHYRRRNRCVAVYVDQGTARVLLWPIPGIKYDR